MLKICVDPAFGQNFHMEFGAKWLLGARCASEAYLHWRLSGGNIKKKFGTLGFKDLGGPIVCSIIRIVLMSCSHRIASLVWNL